MARSKKPKIAATHVSTTVPRPAGVAPVSGGPVRTEHPGIAKAATAQSHQYAMAGMLLGALVAAIVLVTVAIVLLRAEGSTYKVLVAVWLWALPVLGLFSSIGYVLGKGADAVAASEMTA